MNKAQTDPVSPPGPLRPVTDFLDIYPNKKTKTNYQTAIITYLRCFDPSIQTKEDADRYAPAYLDHLKKQETKIHDLKKAANKISETLAPTTSRLTLTIAFLWLEDNGIPISARERKRTFAGMPPAYPQREEPDLSAALFRRIHACLPDWTAVLLLTLLGSGMRISEAMTAEQHEINWTGPRAAIDIPHRKTKNKTKRTIYLTKEASTALQNYLSTRTDTDTRIFPYSVAAAQYHLRKANDTISPPQKNKKRTNRPVHWHMTRKWFISQFSIQSGKHIAEHLAGHTGYLDTAYCRYTREEILQEFLKAENRIEIHIKTETTNS